MKTDPATLVRRMGIFRALFLSALLAATTALVAGWAMYPRPFQTYTLGHSIIRDVNEQWVVALKLDAGVDTVYEFIDRNTGAAHTTLLANSGYLVGFLTNNRFCHLSGRNEHGIMKFRYFEPRTGAKSEVPVQVCDGPLPRRRFRIRRSSNTIVVASSHPENGMSVKFIDTATAKVRSELSFPDRTGEFPVRDRFSDVLNGFTNVAARSLALSPDGRLFALAPAWSGDKRITDHGIDVFDTYTGELAFRVTAPDAKPFWKFDRIDSEVVRKEVDDPSVDLDNKNVVASKTYGVHDVTFSEDGTDLWFVICPRLSPVGSDVWTDPLDVGVPTCDFEGDPWLYYDIASKTIRGPQTAPKELTEDLVYSDEPISCYATSVNGLQVWETSPQTMGDEYCFQVTDKSGAIMSDRVNLGEVESVRHVQNSSYTIFSRTSETTLADRFSWIVTPVLSKLGMIDLIVGNPRRIYCYDWRTNKLTHTPAQDFSLFLVIGVEMHVDTGSSHEIWKLPLRGWNVMWFAGLGCVAFVLCFIWLRRKKELLTASQPSTP